SACSKATPDRRQVACGPVTAERPAPLAGLRIVEVSMLGPGNLTTHLADLGADVIKVEPPQGDYGRRMTWPIVEGVSLLFLHVSRGKRSIVLDLRTDAGRDTFLELARDADAVVEAMRPGGLERRGLGFDRLREVNPRIVFCTISGYGATGPYRDMPSHGIAYDAWAGIVQPKVDDDGFAYMPEHVSIGINAGPIFGALGLLAGVLRARESGEGCQLALAQSASAADSPSCSGAGPVRSTAITRAATRSCASSCATFSRPVRRRSGSRSGSSTTRRSRPPTLPRRCTPIRSSRSGSTSCRPSASAPTCFRRRSSSSTRRCRCRPRRRRSGNTPSR